jgi:hypothetical protein
MKHVSSAWLGRALAAAVLAAGSVTVAAEQGVQPGISKELTVTGRIIKLKPADSRLTLQTTEGRELELSLDSRSEVRLQQREAKISQLKPGTRVRVTYEPANGKNRLISLRDAPVTAQEVQQELREALESAKAYTFQQKEEYQKRLEPVLGDLDERIEGLKEQAKGAGTEARKWYAQAIQELRRERELVREQLAKVQAAAPGAWEEVKSGVSAAWDDLRKAFQRANDRLKEGGSSDQP